MLSGRKNLLNVDEFVSLIKKYDTSAEELTIDGRYCIKFINSKLHNKDFSTVCTFESNKIYQFNMSVRHYAPGDGADDTTVNTFSFGFKHSDDTTKLQACMREDYLQFKHTSIESVKDVKNIFFSYGYSAYWLIDLNSIQIVEV